MGFILRCFYSQGAAVGPSAVCRGRQRAKGFAVLEEEKSVSCTLSHWAAFVAVSGHHKTDTEDNKT